MSFVLQYVIRFHKKAYRKWYAFLIKKVMKLVFYKQHVNWQQYLPSKYSEGLFCILVILTDCKPFPVYDIVLPGNTAKILVTNPMISIVIASVLLVLL